LEANIAR